MTTAEIKDEQYRIIASTEKGSTILKHLIAYRDVSLIPSDNATAENAGTQRLALPHGKDVTQDRITICAENLHIPVGAVFNFPGKTVSIIARQIIAYDVTDTGGTITFDMTGKSGDDCKSTPDNGSKGSDATFSNEWSDVPDFHSWQNVNYAGNGGTPAEGSPGGSGSDGGNFFLVADLVNRCTKEVKIVSLCNGGHGGKGGNGANGGNGGNGYSSNFEYNNDNKRQHYPPDSVCNSGKGGDGSKGGPGGPGGKPGFIVSVTHVPSNDTKFGKISHQVNAVDHCSYGVSGAGGSGGLAGSGGKAGYYIKWHWIDPNETQRGTFGGDGSNAGVGGSPEKPKETGYTGIEDLSTTSTWPWIVAWDPHLFQMVNKRLLFQFQMIFASQYERQDERLLDTAKTDFETSRAWLRRVCDAISKYDTGLDVANVRDKLWLDYFRYTKDSPEGKAAAAARTNCVQSLDQLDKRLNPKQQSDMYNNSWRWISEANMNLLDIDAQVKSLSDLETIRQAFQDAITAKKTEQSALETKSEGLRAFMSDYDTQRAKLVNDEQEAWKKVQDSVKAADSAQLDFKVALGSLWDRVKVNFAVCKTIEEVLGAASTILMFVAPEGKPIAEVGGALSAGTAAASLGGTLSTSQGPVATEYLHGQVLEIGADVSDANLQGAIQLQKGKLGSTTVTGADSAYVNALLVEKNKFQKLCNSYFSDQDVKATKGSFDAFIQAAQKVHEAVIAFNRVAVAIAQLDVNNNLAKDALGAIQATPDPSGPALSLLFQFYDGIYTEQKATVATWLYSTVRALNALTLTRSTILDPLIKLGSFEKIDATVFRTALTTGRDNDVKKWKDSFNNTDMVDLARDVTIGTTNYEYLVTRIKKPGTKNFILDIDQDFVHNVIGMDKSWCEFRVLDMNVFLQGAVSKTSDPIITTNAVHSGSIELEDKHGQIHYFETFTQNYSCMYECVTTSTPPTYVVHSKPAYDGKMRNLNVGKDVSVPLRSIISSWDVSWDPDKVDVSKVTGIVLRINLKYRTKVPSLMAWTLPPVKHWHHQRFDDYSALTAIDIRMEDLVVANGNVVDTTALFAPRLFRSVLTQLDSWRPMRNSNMPLSQRTTKYIDWFLPSGLTNKTVAVGPVIGQAAGKLGSNPKAQAKFMAENPYDGKVENLMETFVRTMNTKLPPDGSPALASEWEVSTSGHQGVAGARVKFPGADSLIKQGKMPELMLRGFAQGMSLFTPTDGRKILAMGNKAKSFVSSNGAQLKQAFDAYIAAGGSLAGCFANLGQNAVVAIAGTKTFVRGDWIITYAVAATTKLHPQDGVNGWVSAYNTKTGETVVGNILLGEHFWRLMDQVNCQFGTQLMAHGYEVIEYLVEAVRTNQTLESVLKKHGRDDLLKARKNWVSVDRWGGRLTTMIRHGLNASNMAFDGFLTKVLTTDNTGNTDAEVAAAQTTNDPPGTYSQGDKVIATEVVSSQSLSAALPHPFNERSPQELQAAEAAVLNHTQKRFSESRRKSLRTKYEQLIDRYVSTLDATPRTPQKQFEALLENTDFTDELKNLLIADLLDGADDAVSYDLSKDPATKHLDGYERAALVEDVIRSEVKEDLLGANGVVEAWSTTRLAENLHQHVKTLADLDADASVALNQVSNDSATVTTRRKALEALDPGDPTTQAAEESLAEAEEALKKSQERSDALDEYKEYKTNGDAKVSEHNAEVDRREKSFEDKK